MTHGHAFPSISPTRRKYTMGEYPSTTFESLSGIKTRIVYGNVRSGSKLSMFFDYMTATQAKQFVVLYDTVMKDEKAYIEFPYNADDNTGAESLKGPDTGVLADRDLVPYFKEDKTVNLSVDLHWKFDKPPVVNSYHNNRYSVTVDLISCIPAPTVY